MKSVSNKNVSLNKRSMAYRNEGFLTTYIT